MPKIETTITSIEEFSPIARIFKLKPAQAVPFKPGQHVIIFKPYEKHYIGRPYSLCSLPGEEELEFVIKLYERGKVTPFLFEKKVGDTLLVSQAFGRVYYRDPDKPLVFMATGTGIAPVVSMCKKLLKKPLTHKVHVFFGCRTEKDIYYNDLFRQWEKDYEDFHFIPCLTAGRDAWKGRRGWVQDNLDAIPNWIENDYYIIGLHVMVDNCRQKLLDAGIPDKQIFTETE